MTFSNLKAWAFASLVMLMGGPAQAFELNKDYTCNTEDWRAFSRGSDMQFERDEGFPAPEWFKFQAWRHDDGQIIAMIAGRQIAEAKYFEGNFGEGHFAAPKFGQIYLEQDDLRIHWNYIAPARGGREITSVQLIAQCAE